MHSGYLYTKFLQSWTGRVGGIAWPPRPPDFLDFFMWCYVKGYVFPVQTQSLSHIKEKIEQAIAAEGKKPLQMCGKRQISEFVIL